MSIASANRQRRLANETRRAQEAAEAQAGAEHHRAQIARQRSNLLRRRRRTAVVILAVTVPLAVAVSFGAGLIAAHHTGPDLRYLIGFGGRYSHTVVEQVVATDDVWRFALAVQCVPVVLALVSWVLSLPWRERGRTFDPAPMWLGAALAPGLAISLLGGFAASAAGESPDDFGPAMSALAPQGIPLLGACVAVLVWSRVDKRRRRGRRG